MECNRRPGRVGVAIGRLGNWEWKSLRVNIVTIVGSNGAIWEGYVLVVVQACLDCLYEFFVGILARKILYKSEFRIL